MQRDNIWDEDLVEPDSDPEKTQRGDCVSKSCSQTGYLSNFDKLILVIMAIEERFLAEDLHKEEYAY